jgi:metal-responsive CopG/Arc/MetJ family transcriptional regulator
MEQKRVALTVSLPPALARKFEQMAKAAAKNKSQLFREMVLTYEQRTLEDEFYRLQRYGAKQARNKGLLTEEDVEALVFQDR